MCEFWNIVSLNKLIHFIALLLLSRLSHVRLCATPSAYQASPSKGFSRQEHWSGLPFPSPLHESRKWKVKLLSRVRLLATPWTAAYQALPTMGFSRQQYWSGVPLPCGYRVFHRICYHPFNVYGICSGVSSFITNISNLFREGNGNPLQYSCLENPMDRGAW